MAFPEQRTPDSVAFERFYRELAPEVRRYAELRAGADVADDVLSETFTVVWRRWEQLPSSHDDRRAWVFGVARNNLRSAARARGRHRLLPWVKPQEDRDHADDVIGADRVTRLLRTLPLSEREAMELTVWAGLAPAQAAQILGCSNTAMTTRLARARKRLEVTLGVDEADEEVHRAR